MFEKDKFSYYLGVFIISPVLALFYGIANFRKYTAKLIIVFFYGAFGYTLILFPGRDSHTLSQTFQTYFQDLSLTDFLNEIYLIMTLRGTEEDEPYMTILSFFVAQLTSNPKWLFLIVGLIYGYFNIKGITLVFEETKKKWNAPLVILLIFFISWVGLNGINAPRNWTGAWVFFCGAMLYLKTEDLKYMFLVMLAPLFHFAYSLITVPFFIYAIFKDLKYVYLTILIVSFIASASTQVVTSYLETTELGEDKVEAYIENPRWQEGGSDVGTQPNVSFHAQYYRLAADVSIQFMFIISILFFGYLSGKNHDSLLIGLASIAMLLLSLSNIFTTIPVLSNRLFVNFGNFALAYLLLLFSRNFMEFRSKQWVINISIPAIFLFLFTQYSMIGDITNFKVLFSPLMYPVLGDDPVSVKVFLRQLLNV